MKRLWVLLCIVAIITLCLFSSAYSSRDSRREPPGLSIHERAEAERIEAEIDRLALRLDHLKSDIATVKLALMSHRSAIPPASKSR